MSLCNTFRLFAVSVALVAAINNANAFSFRRTTTMRRAGDLYADETRVIDLKENTRLSTVNSTTNTNQDSVTSSSKPTIDTNIKDKGATVSNQTNKVSSKVSETTVKHDKPITSNIMKATAKTVPKKFQYSVTTVMPVERNIKPRTNFSNSNSTKVTTDTISNITTNKKTSHLQNKNNTLKTISNIETFNERKTVELKEKLSKSNTDNNDQVVTLPHWKKYTFINRNRVPVEDTVLNTKNKDVKIDAPEIAHSASSLQDTITSDIPSLEKLKNDLLSTTTNIKNGSQNNRSSKFVGQKPDTIKSGDHIKLNSSGTILNEHSKWSVESKRAGFLDYSEKNTQSEVANLTLYSAHNEGTHSANQESPSHQMKDSLKDILLNERVDNNGKGPEEIINREIEQSPTQISNTLNVEKQAVEDILQTKSTNVEKSKNASLYAVNSNYKPLKKIEVQPPKPFIRDPDDNSWRNESISSLGIVFKPKNSSKPFTQVLKNKTEIEWNSLLDKERKNDIPDLRERLEQMAKMRKTKRKKIDSMGNVVYVDYEENSTSNENSNSNENITPLRDVITIPVLNFDPQFFLTASRFPVPTTSEEPQVETYTTTYGINNNKETTIQNRKRKKYYNIPDYYESSESEELDYINVAKIDLKKSVTQKTTQSPFVDTTWPIISYKTTKSDMPERKATIQYFPPLTTKKANLFMYNTDDNSNPTDDNSISTYKPTTNVVPESYPETAIQANGKFSQYHAEVYAEPPVTNKPTTIDTDDVFFKPPPRIDEPLNRYKVISDGGNLNKGSYVIKSYDDFINEADKENHFDRNVEYVPYTEASVQSATANELVKEERTKEIFNEDSDYDVKFRKDVLSRFVENFNRNSERFKSGFPVIFNSSIVHQTHGDGREVASSSAFLRGLHGVAAAPRHTNYKYPYDPHRENLTIDLSPTFEFHYFVPEQEENEEAEQHHT